MKNIEKAAQIIKLLVLDVDGVMTDGSIYLDAEQELFKSFNAKDGMGISCAIRCGLQVAIITGRCSPIIRRRARELGIVEVCENVKEKRSALAELLQKYNLSLNETAYVGDDLNDLPVLTQVGLACAPADAVEDHQDSRLLDERTPAHTFCSRKKRRRRSSASNYRVYFKCSW